MNTAVFKQGNLTQSAPAASSPAADARVQPEGAVHAKSAQGFGSPRWQNVLAILDQVLFSGVSFATSVFVGRLCGRKALGLYTVVWSSLLFLRGIQMEVLAVPYKLFRHQHSEAEQLQYAGSSQAYQWALAALSAVGFGALAIGLWHAWHDAAVVIAILAVVSPLFLLREAVRQLALAHLCMGEVLAVDGSVAVIQVAGLCVLALSFTASVPGVLAVAGCACATTLLGWGLFVRPRLRFELNRLVSDLRHDWQFARWTLASYLIGSTVPFLVPWLMTLTQGAAANGQLAACFTLINVAGIYVAGVSSLYAPRAAAALAEGGPNALRRILLQTMGLYLATLGPFVVLVLALGDLPATWVYGEKYQNVGAVLFVLALHMLVNSLGMTLGSTLWVIKAPRANFPADWCVFMLTPLALVCLAGPFSALGAALAVLLGSSVGVIVRALALRALWNSLSKTPEGEIS